MKYKLTLGVWGSVFAVPNVLVDNYIKLANGIQLKLILFLLRNSDCEFDAETLKTELSAKSDEEIEDAISFWQDRGLLSVENGELTQLPVTSAPRYIAQNAVTMQSDRNEQLTFDIKRHESVRKVDASRPIRYSAKEIGERIKESDRMEHLFSRAEQLCGRPLKNSEQQMIMSIVDYEGLDCDVAAMLLEYCFSTGKTTPKYIQTLAAEWHEKEIDTISRAEERITELRSYNAVEAQLKRDWEMRSAFSAKQKDYINDWSNKMGFSIEMIELAYQMTMDSTGKPAFQYMNKIIESWQQKGFSTPQQVEQERLSYKRENSTESSFDVDDLEKRALEKYRR